MPILREEIQVSSASGTKSSPRTARTPLPFCLRGCRMSAAHALPWVLPEIAAVADASLPVARPRPLEGFAFYRKHVVGLLRRYLQISMEVGRTPCVLGTMVFRGRVSSYRMQTFEDRVIFIFDVEKCLKQLDRISQEVIAHMILEDYTSFETAALTGESVRSVARIYGAALDRLTRLFLEYRLLDPNT